MVLARLLALGYPSFLLQSICWLAQRFLTVSSIINPGEKIPHQLFLLISSTNILVGDQQMLPASTIKVV